MISKEELAKALPVTLKSAATDSLLDKLNSVVDDPIVADTIRNNFIGYTHVLRDGKYKIEDYLNAVSYVSYKLMGLSNQEAYFKTFPNRHAALVAEGKDTKTISSYVSMYTKGKLVNLILEQSLIPVHVLNQDYKQKAINKLAQLMEEGETDRIQMESADKLLTHLATPKDNNYQISVEHTDNSGMTELKNALASLAQQQLSSIRSGESTKSIASQRIIEAEIV